MTINGINISLVTADSRKVVPGSLFVAVRGYAGDGHAYIPQAVEKGAAVVMYDSDDLTPEAKAALVFVRKSIHDVPLRYPHDETGASRFREECIDHLLKFP